jgi:hypothetical protein
MIVIECKQMQESNLQDTISELGSMQDNANIKTNEFTSPIKIAEKIIHQVDIKSSKYIGISEFGHLIKHFLSRYAFLNFRT